MTSPFEALSDVVSSLAKRVRKLEVKPTPSGGASTPYVLEDHDHSGDLADGGVFPVTNLSSGSATDGQIATADGAGGIAFEDIPVSVEAIQFLYNDASTDIAGYKKLLPTHSAAAKETLSIAGITDAQVLEEFVTESGSPNSDFITAGIISLHIHAAKTAGTKELQIKGMVYKRTDPGGVETLIGITSTTPVLTGAETPYDLDIAVGDVDLDVTDRIVVKVIAVVTGLGTAPTGALYVEGDTFSRIAFPAILPTGGAGLEYKIYLWDFDLGLVTAYDPNATGLASAIAATEANDTIIIPDGTYTMDITIPANVTIKGISRILCIIVGTVTMGSGSSLQEISVKPSGNSANPINAIIAQASGISNVIQCDIVPTNIGAGGVNALYFASNDSAIDVKESILDGRNVAVGATGYAAFYESGSSGKVFIYNSICLGSVADDPFNV